MKPKATQDNKSEEMDEFIWSKTKFKLTIDKIFNGYFFDLQSKYAGNLSENNISMFYSSFFCFFLIVRKVTTAKFNNFDTFAHVTNNITSSLASKGNK